VPVSRNHNFGDKASFLSELPYLLSELPTERRNFEQEAEGNGDVAPHGVSLKRLPGDAGPAGADAFPALFSGPLSRKERNLVSRLHRRQEARTKGLLPALYRLTKQTKAGINR
jgi:hypothetical protein